MSKDKKFLDLFLKNWGRIKEPIRPSDRENNIFEEAVIRVSKRENPTMLILGATPEFRDMGIRHGMKPVSCDLASPIFEAMRNFMKESGEEEFIHCNWLDLPEERRYDLIITDGAVNMLSRETTPALFEKISALLNDDGLHIQRTMTINRRFTVDDFEAAAREHWDKQIPMLLWSYTILMVNTIRQLHYPDLTIEELFEQHLGPRLTEEQKEELRPMMFGGKTFMPIQEDLDGMLNTRLDLEQIHEHDGPGYWGMAAQYLHRKKS